MEQIIEIENTDNFDNLSATIYDSHVNVMQDSDSVYMDYQQALTVARAILEHCSDWVDVSVKPEWGLYKIKGDIHYGDEQLCGYATYNPYYNEWNDAVKRFAVRPTHYQPIIQPKP